MFKSSQTYFHPRNLPAWLVLITCLILLWLAQLALNRQIAAQATQEFEHDAQAIIDTIVARLTQHEQILLGGAALFEASTSVERSEWHAYVARLHLAKNYPGILGVGFARVIKPADLQTQIAEVRAEGFPDYTVHPAGERPLYTSIVYLEPFSGRNLAAFGYDMMSEPTRARALRLAVDEDRTAMTGKVTLVQENQGKVQAGFLLYVPIYHKHMPVVTAAQRWAALEGYVYSPYRMDDLMHGILGTESPQVDFSIYDGEAADTETQMYMSAHDAPASPANHIPRFTTQRSIMAYGHTWSVHFQSRPAFESNYQSSLNIPMLILGSSTSIMLFFLISILSIKNVRAQEQSTLLKQLVQEQTRDLRESLDLQTAVLDNAAYAIIATTPEGLITVFNKTAEKLLGYTAEAMIGKQTPAIIHDPEEVAERAHSFSAELKMDLDPGFEVFVIKTRLNLPNEHEWTYIRKDGSHFPVSLSITALKNQQDEITGFLGLAIDITDKLAADLALRENTQHIQTILDNVVDGIITINDAGTVQSFNLAAERIFGYSAREVTGNNVNMLMPEPYHSQHDTYLTNYHNGGAPGIIGTGREVEGLRKDGSSFPMDLAVSRSSHQGQPMYIGLVRDITERKRMEKMKSEFVSTVSHELRTPLTSISGSLGLIAGGALGEIPVQPKQMIELAYKNAQHLTTLINDLLDMEKLVAGKLQVELTKQTLLPIVEQSLQGIHAYAEQYNVRVSVINQTDNAVVNVDSLRLQQVLTNLLSNAVKFSPAGDEVIVSVFHRHNNIRVEVLDHGPGVPDNFREHLFQKFSQADASDSRQKSGTGLGLAISKELIERMHGQVGYQSNEGHGACFYFELPQVKTLPVNTASKNYLPGAPHLLVVEDEPDIGRLFSIMLANAGYNVDIATSGESAMSYLAQYKYDAMTLDLMLPDQSGINLIHNIRSQPHTETLPIIVISAYSEDGRLAIKGDFTAVDWLAKPVNSKQLIAAMHRALPHRTNTRPRVLHVEDNASLSRLIAAVGSDLAEFDIAPTLDEARIKLKQAQYDLVVLDIGLPDGSGWDLLPALHALNPRPPVIVLSGEELTQAQKDTVQMALVKSQTPNDVLLDTLKQLLANKQDTQANIT